MQFIHRLTKTEKALGWNKCKYSHCIRRTAALKMENEAFFYNKKVPKAL